MCKHLFLGPRGATTLQFSAMKLPEEAKPRVVIRSQGGALEYSRTRIGNQLQESGQRYFATELEEL